MDGQPGELGMFPPLSLSLAPTDEDWTLVLQDVMNCAPATPSVPVDGPTSPSYDPASPAAASLPQESTFPPMLPQIDFQQTTFPAVSMAQAAEAASAFAPAAIPNASAALPVKTELEDPFSKLSMPTEEQQFDTSFARDAVLSSATMLEQFPALRETAPNHFSCRVAATQRNFLPLPCNYLLFCTGSC